MQFFLQEPGETYIRPISIYSLIYVRRGCLNLKRKTYCDWITKHSGTIFPLFITILHGFISAQMTFLIDCALTWLRQGFPFIHPSQKYLLWLLNKCTIHLKHIITFFKTAQKCCHKLPLFYPSVYPSWLRTQPLSGVQRLMETCLCSRVM